MKPKLTALVIGSLAAIGFAIPTPTPAEIPLPTPTDIVFQPCQTEDSLGPCYWDSSEFGNGSGIDFLVDSEGNVTRYHNGLPVEITNGRR